MLTQIKGIHPSGKTAIINEKETGNWRFEWAIYNPDNSVVHSGVSLDVKQAKDGVKWHAFNGKERKNKIDQGRWKWVDVQ